MISRWNIHYKASCYLNRQAEPSIENSKKYIIFIDFSDEKFLVEKSIVLIELIKYMIETEITKLY